METMICTAPDVAAAAGGGVERMISRKTLLAIFGRQIAYSPRLANAIGLKPAILVAQLVYWTERGPEDGWIDRSAEDLSEETGLSYREQQVARDTLRRLGILEERHERLEHRLYYRVDAERLLVIFEERISRTNKRAVREPTNAQFV